MTFSASGAARRSRVIPTATAAANSTTPTSHTLSTAAANVDTTQPRPSSPQPVSMEAIQRKVDKLCFQVDLQAIEKLVNDQKIKTSRTQDWEAHLKDYRAQVDSFQSQLPVSEFTQLKLALTHPRYLTTLTANARSAFDTIRQHPIVQHIKDLAQDAEKNVDLSPLEPELRREYETYFKTGLPNYLIHKLHKSDVKTSLEYTDHIIAKLKNKDPDYQEQRLNALVGGIGWTRDHQCAGGYNQVAEPMINLLKPPEQRTLGLESLLDPLLANVIEQQTDTARNRSFADVAQPFQPHIQAWFKMQISNAAKKAEMLAKDEYVNSPSGSIVRHKFYAFLAPLVKNTNDLLQEAGLPTELKGQILDYMQKVLDAPRKEDFRDQEGITDTKIADDIYQYAEELSNHTVALMLGLTPKKDHLVLDDSWMPVAIDVNRSLMSIAEGISNFGGQPGKPRPPEVPTNYRQWFTDNPTLSPEKYLSMLGINPQQMQSISIDAATLATATLRSALSNPGQRNELSKGGSRFITYALMHALNHHTSQQGLPKKTSPQTPFPYAEHYLENTVREKLPADGAMREHLDTIMSRVASWNRNKTLFSRLQAHYSAFENIANGTGEMEAALRSLNSSFMIDNGFPYTVLEHSTHGALADKVSEQSKMDMERANVSVSAEDIQELQIQLHKLKTHPKSTAVIDLLQELSFAAVSNDRLDLLELVHDKMKAANMPPKLRQKILSGNIDKHPLRPIHSVKSVDMLKALVKLGVNIHEDDKQGNNLAHYLCYHDREDVLKELYDNICRQNTGKQFRQPMDVYLSSIRPLQKVNNAGISPLGFANGDSAAALFDMLKPFKYRGRKEQLYFNQLSSLPKDLAHLISMGHFDTLACIKDELLNIDRINDDKQAIDTNFNNIMLGQPIDARAYFYRNNLVKGLCFTQQSDKLIKTLDLLDHDTLKPLLGLHSYGQMVSNPYTIFHAIAENGSLSNLEPLIELLLDKGFSSGQIFRAFRTAQEYDAQFYMQAPIKIAHTMALVEPEKNRYTDTHHTFRHWQGIDNSLKQSQNIYSPSASGNKTVQLLNNSALDIKKTCANYTSLELKLITGVGLPITAQRIDQINLFHYYAGRPKQTSAVSIRELVNALQQKGITKQAIYDSLNERKRIYLNQPGQTSLTYLASPLEVARWHRYMSMGDQQYVNAVDEITQLSEELRQELETETEGKTIAAKTHLEHPLIYIEKTDRMVNSPIYLKAHLNALNDNEFRQLIQRVDSIGARFMHSLAHQGDPECIDIFYEALQEKGFSHKEMLNIFTDTVYIRSKQGRENPTTPLDSAKRASELDPTKKERIKKINNTIQQLRSSIKSIHPNNRQSSVF